MTDPTTSHGTEGRGDDAEQLALKLTIGYKRIDDARTAGLNTTELERFWNGLIRASERAVQELAEQEATNG